MPNIIDEFFVALGFNVRKEGLKEFTNETHSLKGAIMSVGAALGVVKLGEWLKGSVEASSHIAHFAEMHELAATQVAALGRMAIENHSSLEAMESALSRVGSMAGQAALGIGRGAKMFKTLHINVKDAHGATRDINTLLGDIADKMAGKSQMEANAFGRRLGISPEIVAMMRKGREEFQALTAAEEAANPMRERDYKNAEKIETSFLKLKVQMGVIGQQLSAAILPSVVKIAEGFLAWWKSANEATGPDRRSAIDKVREACEWFTDVLRQLKDVLFGVVGWVKDNTVAMTAFKVVVAGVVAIKLGGWFGQVANAIARTFKAFSGISLATKGWLALTGLLVIGIALIIQDLWGYANGMDSLTGRLQKKFPYAVQLMTAALVLLGGALTAVAIKSGVDAYLGIGKLIGSFGKLSGSTGMLGKAFSGMSGKMLGEIGLITAGIYAWKSVVDEIQGNWGAYAGFFESALGLNKNDKGFKLAKESLEARQMGSAVNGMVTYHLRHTPAATGAGDRPVNVTGAVNVHIHTNNEAAVRRGVNKALTRNGQGRHF